MKAIRIFLFFSLFIFTICGVKGQNIDTRFIVPSDTFNTKRFYSASTFSALTYSGFSVGLYNAWYRQYDQTSFHLFNDWNEWNNMDKMGHFYTAYFQGVLCYKGAKWTGLNENKSILTGVILGTLFQSTIEVMDGFSGKWGFSIPDVAYNTLGVGAFVFQQKVWKEQRIQFKMSGYRRNYGDHLLYSITGKESMSLQSRADNLFGSSFAARFLKDYNTQTLWASVNVHSFLNEESKFPKWLNIALGTGSENLFGGFENRWDSTSSYFQLDEEIFPRYRQFFIGIDLDLTRMGINNYYLKSIMQIFNIFKIPGPALEINTLGEIKFHLIHF